MIGKTLLHYRILEKIGTGGMGEVYAAEDTKLHRRVALKILPPEVAGDPERLARFEREATAIAALNHPSIVTIHAVEEAEGLHFMAMELVEGKPLSALIAKRGLPMRDFFAIAIPLADAVAAAHLQGITHRDLKPDNVMVGGDGRVKVLDFGLAKLHGAPAGEDLSTAMPTKGVQTEAGVVMGTVAYMSPEQAEGKEVDPRTDVFSLGVVLYEMATGQRPFRGDTKISIITAIMRDTPESVTSLATHMPRHLSRIIKRCLAKDPLRRYQTALEVRNELDELKREIDTGETLPADAIGALRPSPARRRRMLPVWIALGGVVGAGAVWLLLQRPAPAAGTPEAPVTGTFTRLTFGSAPEEEVSLSPDGKDFAYASPASGNWDIYVQRVGGRNPLNLTKDSPADDTQPAFSPDGEKIAFHSEREGGGIFVMGATGESVKRLTDRGCDPAWSPDGREIAYATECFPSPLSRSATSELWIVEESSGQSRKIFDGDAVQPSWSPGGGRIAYWGLPAGSGERDVWTIRSDGTDPVPVTQDGSVDWSPVWSPDGRYLYFTSDRGGSMNIWRVPIDERSGRTQGQPQQVTSGVSAWSQNPSLSKDGKRLAYVSRSDVANVFKMPFDPAAGRATGPPQPVLRVSGMTDVCYVSPDGSLLACQRSDARETISVMRADGSEARDLTNNEHKNRLPRWSPDGSTLAFYSDRSGSYEIWSVRPDGSDLRQLTETPGESRIFPVWSADGTRMIAQALREGSPTLIFDPRRPWKEQTPEELPPPEGDKRLVGFWSWSSKNVLAGFFLSTSGGYDGIVTYDVGQRRYDTFTDKGMGPVWLHDGRRLLFADGHAIRLLDTSTRQTLQVATFAPENVNSFSLSLPRDDSAIYYSLGLEDADVWLLDLK